MNLLILVLLFTARVAAIPRCTLPGDRENLGLISSILFSAVLFVWPANGNLVERVTRPSKLRLQQQGQRWFPYSHLARTWSVVAFENNLQQKLLFSLYFLYVTMTVFHGNKNELLRTRKLVQLRSNCVSGRWSCLPFKFSFRPTTRLARIFLWV